MDTSQYMTMFLEESMDNLQTLNESLLELEKNPDYIRQVLLEGVEKARAIAIKTLDEVREAMNMKI